MGNRPRKKTRTYTPTKKYAYSSCFKQCDTMYPKKRAGCRQKCYDKNAAKKEKEESNLKSSSCARKCETAKFSKRVCRKKCDKKRATKESINKKLNSKKTSNKGQKKKRIQ